MKKIYLVLTYTGTFLSNIIRLYTKKEYSHISLSLDPSLKTMYSFGRKNAYNAFNAGFIIEEINKGTYKRFSKTKCQVYEISITGYKYHKLKKYLKLFLKDQKKYKYDTIGLMLYPLNIKLGRKHHYYCSEFIRFLFEITKINPDLPILVSPEKLVNHQKNKKLIYEGLLKEYM